MLNRTMKRALSSFILSQFLCLGVPALTLGEVVEVSGEIDQLEAVWTAEQQKQTIHVVDNLTVPSGVCLIIGAGTQVLITPNKTITVYGRIVATGLAAQKISFESLGANNEPWRGLDLRPTGEACGVVNPGSILKHVILRDVQIGVMVNDLSIPDGRFDRLTLDHCAISQCGFGVQFFRQHDQRFSLALNFVEIDNCVSALVLVSSQGHSPLNVPIRHLVLSRYRRYGIDLSQTFTPTHLQLIDTFYFDDPTDSFPVLGDINFGNSSSDVTYSHLVEARVRRGDGRNVSPVEVESVNATPIAVSKMTDSEGIAWLALPLGIENGAGYTDYSTAYDVRVVYQNNTVLGPIALSLPARQLNASNSSFEILEINHNLPPTARFTATPALVPLGGRITFKALGHPFPSTQNSFDPDGDRLFFSWDFDVRDGFSEDATGSEVTHPFNTEGEYQVTLTVRDQGVDGYPQEASFEFGTVKVAGTPGANITVSSEQPLVGEEVDFDGSGSVTGAAVEMYEWEIRSFPTNALIHQEVESRTGVGSNTVWPTGKLLYTFSDVGAYKVMLTVTDTFGQSGSAAVGINVRRTPVAALAIGTGKETSPGSGIYCVPYGSLVSFDALGSQVFEGTAQLSWDFGDGSSDNGPFVYHTFRPRRAPTDYTVRLTVSDGVSGLSATATLTVRVRIRVAVIFAHTRGDPEPDYNNHTLAHYRTIVDDMKLYYEENSHGALRTHPDTPALDAFEFDFYGEDGAWFEVHDYNGNFHSHEYYGVELELDDDESIAQEDKECVLLGKDLTDPTDARRARTGQFRGGCRDNTRLFHTDAKHTVREARNNDGDPNNDFNTNEYSTVVVVHSGYAQQNSDPRDYDLMTTQSNIVISEHYPMDTWAHEFGHVLGTLTIGTILSDRYGGALHGDIEDWGLMGNHNNPPDHMISFSKQHMEWLDYNEIGLGVHNIRYLSVKTLDSDIAIFVADPMSGISTVQAATEGEQGTADNDYEFYIFEARNPDQGDWDKNPGGINDPVLVVYSVTGSLSPNVYETDSLGNVINDASGNPIIKEEGGYYGHSDATVNVVGHQSLQFSLDPTLWWPAVDKDLQVTILLDDQHQGRSMQIAVQEKTLLNMAGGIIYSTGVGILNTAESAVDWIGDKLSLWDVPAESDATIDLDLHAYDSTGRHVGVNYETGEYEIEIPGAIASGDTEWFREWIFLPDDIEATFEVNSRDLGDWIADHSAYRDILQGFEYTLETRAYDSDGEREVTGVTTHRVAPGDANTHQLQSSEMRIRRGDCNDDGTVDIADPVATLFAVFLGEFDITCDDACDSNDDGTVDISDAIATLGVLFLGQGTIPLPGMEACGVDPTEDELGCERLEHCP